MKKSNNQSKKEHKNNDVDIYDEINKVFELFNAELKSSHVLDENNNVINPKTFENIVDKNLKRLYRLEKYVSDEAGVTTDRNGNNILLKNIDLLSEMKAHHSVHPYSDDAEERLSKEKERLDLDRPSLFQTAIKKLFRKRKNTHQPEVHSR